MSNTEDAVLENAEPLPDETSRDADAPSELRSLLVKHPKLVSELAQYSLDNAACDPAETHLCWARVLASARRQQRADLWGVISKEKPHRAVGRGLRQLLVVSGSRVDVLGSCLCFFFWTGLCVSTSRGALAAALRRVLTFGQDR